MAYVLELTAEEREHSDYLRLSIVVAGKLPEDVRTVLSGLFMLSTFKDCLICDIDTETVKECRNVLCKYYLMLLSCKCQI